MAARSWGGRTATREVPNEGRGLTEARGGPLGEVALAPCLTERGDTVGRRVSVSPRGSWRAARPPLSQGLTQACAPPALRPRRRKRVVWAGEPFPAANPEFHTHNAMGGEPHARPSHLGWEAPHVSPYLGSRQPHARPLTWGAGSPTRIPLPGERGAPTGSGSRAVAPAASWTHWTLSA